MDLYARRYELVSAALMILGLYVYLWLNPRERKENPENRVKPPPAPPLTPPWIKIPAVPPPLKAPPARKLQPVERPPQLDVQLSVSQAANYWEISSPQVPQPTTIPEALVGVRKSTPVADSSPSHTWRPLLLQPLIEPKHRMKPMLPLWVIELVQQKTLLKVQRTFDDSSSDLIETLIERRLEHLLK